MQVQAQKIHFDQLRDQRTLFKDPVVVCIKVHPGILEAKHVYWYAYSMGKIKNIYVGYYMPSSGKVKIKGVCAYSPRILERYINHRTTQAFEPVAQYTINRHQVQIARRSGAAAVAENNCTDMIPFLVQSLRSRPDVVGFLQISCLDIMQHLERSVYIDRAGPITCDILPPECFDSKDARCKSWNYGASPMKKHMSHTRSRTHSSNLL